MNKQKKILVVDDTEATRYAVSRILTSEGYLIAEAATGADALNMVLTEKPDLVTLDIHLPDIIGFEVCRRIKHNPLTAHIPVLQVSASYVTSKDRIHGLEGGADSYLTHPFEPPVLVATVKALLRGSDLVEQLRLSEERTRLSLEDAKAASHAKSRFLSNMSHEIRTPLGVIQGFAELALDPSLSEEERSQYLLTIKRNAFNLTKLLGEVLDLAKIEAGQISIEKISFSFPQLVSDVVASLDLQAREKAIALTFEIVGGFPEFVFSDPTKIRQVITNLISNALKFTERGGVEVTAAARPRQSENDVVVLEFTVKDSGIGLNTEQRSRLFEAFMQADSTTTRRFGGTGLGLNLSKKLIEALGGSLHLVTSEPGLGSTFQFTFDAGVMQESALNYRFPAERKSSMAEAPPKFTDELTGMKILIVEDSPDNQLLFTRYLKGTGAKVALAVDGVEGVRFAQNDSYDVILMDVQMPNMDGYDATKILRAGGHKNPIIALTAHAMQEDRDRALASGFTSYITKPVDATLLVTTLLKYRNYVGAVV